MTEIKKKEIVENIIKGVYYCYNNAPGAVITKIGRYVDSEVEEIKYKKDNKNRKQSGVLRNDLPGFARVRGNKIYIRYRNKDISTGFNDTKQGWKNANDFWAEKVRTLEYIEEGIIKTSDTIENIFKKFLEYKMQFQKVSNSTVKLYEYRINEVFGEDLNITLSEKNIKIALDNFIKNTKLSATSINIILQGIRAFLNWSSDDDQQYIPHKNYIKKAIYFPKTSLFFFPNFYKFAVFLLKYLKV